LHPLHWRRLRLPRHRVLEGTCGAIGRRWDYLCLPSDPSNRTSCRV